MAWGLADFGGGLATRRIGALRVLTVSYPAGALVITLVALFLVPGEISGNVIGLSLYTGIVGTLAMLFLYAALAVGPMGIVSPLTAVGGAAVPVIAGLVRGESLTPLIALGIVLALVAVILVSRESGPHPPVSAKGLLLSGAAGLFIGLYLARRRRAPRAWRRCRSWPRRCGWRRTTPESGSPSSAAGGPRSAWSPSDSWCSFGTVRRVGGPIRGWR